MNIGSITKTVNTQTEESFSTSQILEFANDAIAKINIECGANFPYLDLNGTEYTAFPSKWQRALFLPFAVGRVKQVDSSQFEYSDSFGEFISNLNTFKTMYPIPNEYKDTNEEKLLGPDFSLNPWRW